MRRINLNELDLHGGASEEGGEGGPSAKEMEGYGSMVMMRRSPGVFSYRVGSGRGPLESLLLDCRKVAGSLDLPAFNIVPHYWACNRGARGLKGKFKVPIFVVLVFVYSKGAVVRI